MKINTNLSQDLKLSKQIEEIFINSNHKMELEELEELIAPACGCGCGGLC